VGQGEVDFAEHADHRGSAHDRDRARALPRQELGGPRDAVLQPEVTDIPAHALGGSHRSSS
jgi:hypothetical protein